MEQERRSRWICGSSLPILQSNAGIRWDRYPFFFFYERPMILKQGFFCIFYVLPSLYSNGEAMYLANRYAYKERRPITRSWNVILYFLFFKVVSLICGLCGPMIRTLALFWLVFAWRFPVPYEQVRVQRAMPGYKILKYNPVFLFIFLSGFIHLWPFRVHDPFARDSSRRKITRSEY